MMSPQEHRTSSESALYAAYAASDGTVRNEYLQAAAVHAMLGILGTLIPPPDEPPPPA